MYRHQHVTRVAELQPFHDNSQTPCRESAWRGSHRRDVILRLRWCCSQYFDGWVFKNIFLVNRWRKKIEYMWKLFVYINSIRYMPRNSCVFLSFKNNICQRRSQFHSLRYSSIMLLSYSSVCYSSLSLLNIPSCPYIFLCDFFSCTLFFLFLSPFTLMITYIWLWTLQASGSHILTLSTNSFCEFKTMSNTFSPLVASNTC